tara:strand:+ start:7482 stop:8072 length:591 start_codon:yes stop_codon:yes gene_type:complete
MTAKIKLNAASGGGSFSIQAPSSSSNNRIFTLPDVADAAMATVNGITEFDSWFLTTAKTTSGVVASNLVRNNAHGAASQIGTGMTESSGIFTFPSTGKYLVIFNGQFAINGSSNIVVTTQVTTNNSSYLNHTRALDGNNGSGERSGSGSSFAFIDVTDTSQVKVRFNVTVIGGSDQLSGATSTARTSFTFIRIGDT